MTEQTYAYPFDPTGTRSTNLVSGEMHSISPQTNIPPDYPNFFLVVPQVGPFFEDNFKIEHYSSNGNRELILGVDYFFAYSFISASRATGKRLYGAIAINNMELTGAVRLRYQTVGGPWTINLHKATQLLANVSSNPRITTWESVVDLPAAFPVIDHEWHLDDMVGMSDVVDALATITDNVKNSGQDAILAHIRSTGNVHDLTPSDIGLGNLPNFPVATYQQIDDGDENTLVTPHLLDYKFSQMLNGEGSSAITSRTIGRKNTNAVTWMRIAYISKSIEELEPYATANNYPSLTLLVSNNASSEEARTNVDLVSLNWRPGHVKLEQTTLLRESTAEYYVRLVSDRPELWVKTESQAGETTVVKLSDGNLYNISLDTTGQETRPLGLTQSDVTNAYVDMSPYATYRDTSDLGMSVVNGISDAIIALNQS